MEMVNKYIELNLEKYEDDIYRIFSNIDHKEIRDTLVAVVEKFPAVLKEARKYELRWEHLSDEIEDLENEVDILKSDLKEDTLDWEMAMDTFYEIKGNINPQEFEKLIKEKYGNK